jgi:hypothetical protein
MSKPLPLLILAILVIYLVWINPTLIFLAGRLFVILAGLVVGLFFGSFYAKARYQKWTLHTHSKYIARLLLERLR